MGKVNIYKGLSNEIETHNVNGKLSDVIKSICPTLDISKCVILNAGKTETADYIVKENDIIFVREVANGVTGMVVMAIIGVVCAAVSLGVGIASAVMQKQAQEEADKAARASKAMSRSTEQLPFLKGAKNRCALGYNIPFVMGTMFNTPYALTSGCYAVNGYLGSRQDWLVSLVVGYAPLDVTEIKVGTNLVTGGTVQNTLTVTKQSRQVQTGRSLVTVVDSRGYGHQEWKADYETRYYLRWSLSRPSGQDIQITQSTTTGNITFNISENVTSGQTGEYSSLGDLNGAPQINTQGFTTVSTSGTSLTFEGAGNSNIVEIAENGDFKNPALSVLNQKVTATSYGDEVPHKFGDDTEWREGLSKQLESNTYKADIGVLFQGLQRYDDGWKTRRVQIKIQWKTTDSDWQNCGTIDTGDVNSNKTVRFSQSITWSAEQCVGKDITIRLIRETPCCESNSRETCILSYINCYQYDAQKSTSENIVPCMPVELPWRDRCTRIALRLKANDSTKDTLDEINVIVSGKARTWNGKKWSAKKTVTRNPAAWILEILTSPVHPSSQFSDEEINLKTLGALYEYCEEKQFYCDGIVIEDTKKSDLISQILLECGATMFLDTDSRYSFAIEKAQNVPIALLNEESVTSITASKTFERKPFALKSSFTNRDVWAIDTRYMAINENGSICCGAQEVYALRGDDKNKVITEASFKFVTTWNHLYLLMRRQLAKLKLQPREITVKVGKEGDFYPLYSLVLLQTQRLKIGLSSGLIRAANNGIVTTDSICDFSDTSKRYGIIIQTQNRATIKCEVEPFSANELKTRKVKCLALNATLNYGDIYSFGELDEDGNFERVTNKMQIVSTKQNADGWELGLRDYNDAIFEEGDVPEYKTNLTTKKEQSTNLAPVTLSDVENAVINSKLEITQTNATPPQDVSVISAIAGKDGAYLKADVAQSAKLSDVISRIIWQIKRGENASFEDLENNSKEFFYTWEESEKYKEADFFENYLFRAKAVNSYGIESQNWTQSVLFLDTYGTWELPAPTVLYKPQGRTCALEIGLTKRADNKEVYGAVQYKIQISKPNQFCLLDGDKEKQIPEALHTFDGDIFYKPATTKSPYESEDNYKDGDGFVISGNNYTQVLPLIGQKYNERNPQDTRYKIKVTPFNEKGNGSESAVVEVIASSTSAYDLAKNLADANFVLGHISGDGIKTDDTNFWQLADNPVMGTGDDAWKSIKGAMQVGDKTEFLKVIPTRDTLPDGTVYTSYRIEFKMGTFLIDAHGTKLNGELVIYNEKTPLTRTRLTPNGTYYEHRESVLSEDWREIASNNTNGVMTPQVFNNGSLYISNQGITERRALGADIGNAYLSSSSKVYHFDENLFDQNGNNDLEFDLAPNTILRYVGERTPQQNDIDFTPAILAVAPYATISNALYGQFSVHKTFPSCAIFTVDFWIEYIHAENQVLFEVGNTGDKIALVISSKECFFEVGVEDVSGLPFNEEIKMSRLYKKVDKEKAFNPDYIYYEKQGDDFVVKIVTSVEYNDLVQNEELYEQTVPFNMPKEASSYIRHKGQTQSETIDLDTLGVDFRSNTWLHMGIVASEDNIKILCDNKEYNFTRYEKSSKPLEVSLNSTKNSFILDELFIDTEVCETSETFFEHTQNRIPWASLSKGDDAFVITASNLNNFRTNIFDTPVFKRATENLIMPIGYVYVQYPFMKSAPELYPQFTWEAQNYEGAFFRASGGEAADFGEKQNEGLPNITGFLPTFFDDRYDSGSGAFSPSTSKYSATSIKETWHGINYTLDASKSNAIYGASEHVTPENYTIIIWKRIS